jgi:hypothetical protein
MDAILSHWSWYWRDLGPEEYEADGSIYAEVWPGHAYAIAKCPRYMSKEQWAEYAAHICNLHNANVK